MSTCKLCDSPQDTLEFEIEQELMKMIKNQNPQWQEKDGGCSKCVEYYQGLADNVEILD